MDELKFHRILLKLSGESLAGPQGFGIDAQRALEIALRVKDVREMGVDVPADVYTIPYAVKMILAAKARRDAGETLVLPRNEEQKGGAAGC